MLALTCGLTAVTLMFAPEVAMSATFPAACSGTTGDAPSLVAAFVAANGATGEDTVQLQPGCTYTLTGPDNHWYGPNGLPAISSTITVEGNGARIVRAPGVGFRFFFVAADVADPDTDNYVSPAASIPGGGRLTLRDLTLQGGSAIGGASRFGGGGAGMGGAIFSQGEVVIERSTITDNSALGGRSGCPPFPKLCIGIGDGGGGMGTTSSGLTGGGFGPSVFGGGSGGSPFSGRGGGGAGFRYGEDGGSATVSTGGAGGGPATGTGGAAAQGGGAGDGSGGGSDVDGGSASPGGAFGFGGGGNSGGGSGSGGGVGGGGGGSTGGFGGGDGGFGGGGGRGADSGNFVSGTPGFGGGTPTGTDGGGGAGMGGAIFNMQGELTVRNSTLVGNSAFGGPDKVPDPAKGIGGAVFNMSGSFTAIGSTFANNTAAFDGASIFSLVYDGATARTAQTTLRDTIVSNGTGPVDLASSKPTFITPPNLGSADAAVGEANLVRTMAAREGGTITGTPLTSDPLLGALQDNGGPTPTMAPAAGSPVIDAGSAFGLSTDQRGLARPSDFAALANAGDGSDIGAVELQSPAPAAPAPGPAGSTPAFGPDTLVTLRLAQRRIRARGPVRVVVRNRNDFQVRGRLGARRRRVRLRARSFSVPAHARTTVRLRLPRRLRRVLRREHRLVLRLRAVVHDPAGNTRVVTKRVVPRLRR